MTRRSNPLDDERFMREALALASRGAGKVSPNPMVGALLVKHGRVIARGWHRGYGQAHAEIECLKNVREPVKGATMYVTLEPCSHQGKTPPCAPVVAESGVARVVVSMKDPNPRVAGRGIALLRKCGVQVDVGPCEEEARYLNRSFVVHITQQRPYVHVKLAQTLDGRIAGGPGRWISSEQSRKLVHRWRALHDAVLVGAGTMIGDDPRLNVRHAHGRDPRVVILDGRLRTPADAKVFASAKERQIIVCTSRQSLSGKAAKARSLARAGVDVLGFDLPDEADSQAKSGLTAGRLDLRTVMAELYGLGIGSLLVEGGSEIAASFVKAELVDEISLIIAPKFFGAGVHAFSGIALPPRTNRETMMKTIVCEESGVDVVVRALRERYSRSVVGLV